MFLLFSWTETVATSFCCWFFGGCLFPAGRLTDAHCLLMSAACWSRHGNKPFGDCFPRLRKTKTLRIGTCGGGGVVEYRFQRRNWRLRKRERERERERVQVSAYSSYKDDPQNQSVRSDRHSFPTLFFSTIILVLDSFGFPCVWLLVFFMLLFRVVCSCNCACGRG